MFNPLSSKASSESLVTEEKAITAKQALQLMYHHHHQFNAMKCNAVT